MGRAGPGGGRGFGVVAGAGLIVRAVMQSSLTMADDGFGFVDWLHRFIGSIIRSRRLLSSL